MFRALMQNQKLTASEKIEKIINIIFLFVENEFFKNIDNF